MGLAPIWRGIWPRFKPQLLWWGLQQRSHGPIAIASHSVSRSESGGEGHSRQESVAIVSSHELQCGLLHSMTKVLADGYNLTFPAVTGLGELRLSLDSLHRKQTNYLAYLFDFLSSKSQTKRSGSS